MNYHFLDTFRMELFFLLISFFSFFFFFFFFQVFFFFFFFFFFLVMRTLKKYACAAWSVQAQSPSYIHVRCASSSNLQKFFNAASINKLKNKNLR